MPREFALHPSLRSTGSTGRLGRPLANSGWSHVLSPAVQSSLQRTDDARTLSRFGTVATVLEMIPIASVVFSFTNTGKFWMSGSQ